MTIDVAVADFGIGNLFSVRRALEHCGAEVVVSDDPRVLLEAQRLVLPGVGAFANGMQGLVDRGLDVVVREFAGSGKPLLGICLGMQMLASFSEEFGRHDGLDIIRGRVVAIPASAKVRKIPHIGWVELLAPPARNDDWQGTILADTRPKDAVYLVHSYMVEPEDEAHRLADCDYEGQRICAAVQRNNVYGVQFHPEKSGPVGLRILAQFLRA